MTDCSSPKNYSSFNASASNNNNEEHIADGITKFGNKIRKLVFKFSSRQWFALLGISYEYFATIIGFTMITSFFGKEAIERDVSDLDSGLIFGSCALVGTVATPLLGYAVVYTGAKPMLLAGIMLSCVSSLMFSQVFRFTSHNLFVIGCYVTRCLLGLGNAAYFLGFLIILAQEWNGHMTFALGFAEIFNAVGLVTGPIIGGWLYESAGFQVPGIFSGVAIFIGFIVNFFALKEPPHKVVTGNTFSLLRNRNIIASALVVMMMFAALGFSLPVLYQHMQAIKENSPVLVGTMVCIMAASYAISSLLVGIFAKTKFAEKSLLLSGIVIVGISYLIIGPSPILSVFHFNVVTVDGIAISMFVLGIGTSMAIVPSFSYMNSEACADGMPDNFATYRLIGGLINTVTSFGAFMGPLIGSGLTQYFNGFKLASSTFAAIFFGIALIFCVMYTLDWWRNRKSYQTESTALLEDSSKELRE